MVLLLVALATPLLGQSSPGAITVRLRDRPLFIRGFWSDDTLRFDANGNLSAHSGQTTFTLDGFSFTSLKLKDGLLTISGHTVGVEFHDGKSERVDVPFSKRTLKITAPANGDFGPALDAIFADGIEALAPSLPDYWQPWARKAYPAAYAAGASAPRANTTASDSATVRKIEGSVIAPKLLRQSEANFTDAAVMLKNSGTVVVGFFVETDGKPAHLSIVKPLGLGLDEAAVFAVREYQFAPAMQDGQPVRVELNVQVGFQF